MWIPKPDGRQRPPGIAALEDKVVRHAVVQVLNRIREEDLDIRSFFDKVGHDHLERFIRHRIGDERLVRLILKWLRAGVMEDGKRLGTEEGTPQGAVISPLLANLCLHYVPDLRVEAWRKKVAHGDVIVVRYADDAVPGFQHQAEAERFLADLRERLGKFGLERNSEKTRLIEFGRYAAERRAERGKGKPETFNFPGFTHICGKNHVTGRFIVLRRTIGKRMAAKLKDLRQKLRRRMHARTSDTVTWLKSVVCGYFQYHAIPGNEDRMKAFRNEVLRMWLWPLRRRSQRNRWTWDKFLDKPGNLLPEVEVLHPYPDVRFASDHPNFGAGNAPRAPGGKSRGQRSIANLPSHFAKSCGVNSIR